MLTNPDVWVSWPEGKDRFWQDSLPCIFEASPADPALPCRHRPGPSESNAPWLQHLQHWDAPSETAAIQVSQLNSRAGPHAAFSDTDSLPKATFRELLFLPQPSPSWL